MTVLKQFLRKKSICRYYLHIFVFQKNPSKTFPNTKKYLNLFLNSTYMYIGSSSKRKNSFRKISSDSCIFFRFVHTEIDKKIQSAKLGGKSETHLLLNLH